MADSLLEAKDLTLDIAKRDTIVMDTLIEKIPSLKKDSAEIFVVLLDGTHHQYYWPEDFPAKFSPYLESFHYLSMNKNLDGIKNRYKNSIFYLDFMMAKFFKALKDNDLYDDAIIIFTGDHGEEFREEGRYFHGTELCLPQSQVPIYYHLPGVEKLPYEKSISSHIDIFPTILDYLECDAPTPSLIGTSVLQPGGEFALSCRPSHPTPIDFYIHNGDYKVVFEFVNTQNIYAPGGLEIKGGSDNKGHPLHLGTTDQEIITKVQEDFGPYLEKVFPFKD